MKKIFILFLAVIMALAVASCGEKEAVSPEGEQSESKLEQSEKTEKEVKTSEKTSEETSEKAPDNTEKKEETESKEEAELPTPSTKTLAYFLKFLSDGEYTMELKSVVQGTEVIMKSAFKDEMMYSENDMDGIKSIMVMRDGFQYVIEHGSKMVIKTKVLNNGAVMDMFADEVASYEAVTASGKTEYNGKVYDYEEFTVEGEAVQYLLDGDDIKFIKATVDGTESVIEIVSVKKGADASLFEIPEDYRVIAY